MSKMGDETLSQEEVWDDSALVKSWNEAYQEYLKYHSLVAKGEKVNVATLHAEKKVVNNNNNDNTSNTGPTTSQPQPGNPAEIDLLSEGEGSVDDPATAAARPQLTPAAVTALPQALAATVQDESMKNLMMSWYYAGYYTGLYEGKQQGYASAQQALKGG